MRATLRRSCNACAKAKLRCDLRLPQCSRCSKKRSACVYANEPVSAQNRSVMSASNISEHDTNTESELSLSSATTPNDSLALRRRSVDLSSVVDASFDPFDSYPPTRLPRVLTQRLIHWFLSNIAFTYYPLDLSTTSNPFVVEWWPLALADPTLFHVSLQTASLDEERRAQKGFPISEMLMMDSVSLLRRKLEDEAVAVRDETLDSVVTLAAIEHGKRNIASSRAHVNAMKQMVGIRGGINELKRTSPLTARMIAWVSMLVTEAPQFEIQDEPGFAGTGIAPTSQWQLALTDTEQDPTLDTLDDIEIDPTIANVLVRLRSIFHFERLASLSNTDIHDLTCFVVHKLLLLPPLLPKDGNQSVIISECFRYALVLYMLCIHGTTYYSHDHLANNITTQLKRHLENVINCLHNSAGVWILTVGLSVETPHRKWFVSQACALAVALDLQTWEDVLVRLDAVFWTRSQAEELVQHKWEQILALLAG